MSLAPDRRVYVALDVDDLDEAERLARAVGGTVGGFKIGLQLFGRHGTRAVERLAPHGDIFLDLKFHDIPNTVGGAAASVAQLGVRWFTVHATGGARMMRRAVESAGDAGVLAVTVLTSHSDEELAAIGLNGPCHAAVSRLAALARDAGVQGAVCSPLEVAKVREIFPEATLMVPGIRPASAVVGGDDQTRVATPVSAVRDGADLLVVGRPITRAGDPRAAALAIADELARG